MTCPDRPGAEPTAGALVAAAVAGRCAAGLRDNADREGAPCRRHPVRSRHQREDRRAQ